MNEKDFLAFYSGYFSEEVDSINQIALHRFEGEALFEYTKAAIGKDNPLFSKIKQRIADLEDQSEEILYDYIKDKENSNPHQFLAINYAIKILKEIIRG